VGFGGLREAFGAVAALLALAAVFAVGGAGVTLVNERRGSARASEAERRVLDERDGSAA